MGHDLEYCQTVWAPEYSKMPQQIRSSISGDELCGAGGGVASELSGGFIIQACHKRGTSNALRYSSAVDDRG